MIDAHSHTLATTDDALLRVFNDAGVLTAADIHVTSALQRLSGVHQTDGVRLSTALAVRALRHGSVCVEVEQMREVTVDDPDTTIDIAGLPWVDEATVLADLQRSNLVGPPTGGQKLRPLRLARTDDGRHLLYLTRYFEQEHHIREILHSRDGDVDAVDDTAVQTGLAALFPTTGTDLQREAAAAAVRQQTTVLAGGPGTGKTYTVARILRLLHAQHGPALRVALAAPTGRAAAQLEQSVRAEIGTDIEVPAAVTLHRLLGWRADSRSRFSHDAEHRLPFDVVVIDEASMVSLTHMARLLAALRPTARLILVGDPDQLASVDAGAVLADLVERPQSRAITLTQGRRFGREIGELAAAVVGNDPDRVIELLRGGNASATPVADGGTQPGPVQWIEVDDPIAAAAAGQLDAVRADVVDWSRQLEAAAATGDAAAALAAVNRHRLLCAHREGPYGAGQWSRLALGWLGAPSWRHDDWLVGQPVMAVHNNYDLEIFNGDTGVIVASAGGPRAAFLRGGRAQLLQPNQVAGMRQVYAMTVHRSQGSQYDTVTVVVPPLGSSLGTRELLYTAITRARHRIRIVGSEEDIRAAVGRKVMRASGLRGPITELPGGA